MSTSPYSRRARKLGVLASLSIALLTGGCSMVHIGRQPATRPADAAMMKTQDTEIFALRSERAMLQSELSIARLEGATLRTMVDAPCQGGMTAERAEDLAKSVASIADMKAQYASLVAEYNRVSGTSAADRVWASQMKARFGDAEDRLASALHGFTILKDENARLKAEVRQIRGQNARLVDQVRSPAEGKMAAERSLAQATGADWREQGKPGRRVPTGTDTFSVSKTTTGNIVFDFQSGKTR